MKKYHKSLASGKQIILLASAALLSLPIFPENAKAQATGRTSGTPNSDATKASEANKVQGGGQAGRQPDKAESLQLSVGEIKLIPLNGTVRRLAVGNGKFLSATVVEGNILVIGESAGSTSVLAWTTQGVRQLTVKVANVESASMKTAVDNIIAKNSDLNISDIGGKYIIGGTAPRQTLEQLASLVGSSEDYVLEARDASGAPIVRSVIFRLHFVEVKKSFIESIGIQWNRSMQGPVVGLRGIAKRTGIFSSIGEAQSNANLLDPTTSNFVAINGHTSGLMAGMASTLASSINLAVNNGDARVLASPELTAKSGGKAKLQVGGEVPIPLAGALGTQTVEFKPYGVILNIEPFIDADNVIRAKVSAEMSQIDPSVSVNGIPGFLTRQTSTDIMVKPGDMVALSGIISNELANSIDKVPGLGNIPILGRLFRSDGFRHQQTDLVVLVEPQILDLNSGLEKEVLNRGIANQNDYLERAGKAPLPNVDISPNPFSGKSRSGPGYINPLRKN